MTTSVCFIPHSINIGLKQDMHISALQRERAVEISNMSGLCKYCVDTDLF
jgi:hypothetical protein